MASASSSKVSSDENSVESLVEIFSCFICLETVNDARLCPYCSKLACSSCLERSLLTSSRCPHCREYIELEEPVKCRWTADVITKLEKLRAFVENCSIHSEQLKLQSTVENCSIHSEKLTIYCNSCTECICYECALWDAHNGHQFKKLDEIYNECLSKINENVDVLKQKLVEIDNLSQRVVDYIGTVRAKKDERVHEIEMVVASIFSRLNLQFDAKIEILDDKRNALADQSQRIKDLLETADHQIKNLPKPSLIDSYHPYIIGVVHDAQNQSVSFVPEPVADLFPNEIAPFWSSKTLIVDNFLQMQKNKQPVHSEALEVDRLAWKLKVSPDGVFSNRSTGYFWINLEVFGIFPVAFADARYNIKIEMLHPNAAERNITRRFVVGTKSRPKVLCRHFYRNDSLLTNGFLNSEDGSLTFKFSVRPVTIFQQCMEQKWYIDYLKEKEEEKSQVQKAGK